MAVTNSRGTRAGGGDAGRRAARPGLRLCPGINCVSVNYILITGGDGGEGGGASGGGGPVTPPTDEGPVAAATVGTPPLSPSAPCLFSYTHTHTHPLQSLVGNLYQEGAIQSSLVNYYPVHLASDIYL